MAENLSTRADLTTLNFNTKSVRYTTVQFRKPASAESIDSYLLKTSFSQKSVTCVENRGCKHKLQTCKKKEQQNVKKY